MFTFAGDTFLAFDTVITISLYEPDSTTLLKKCEELCLYYDGLLSKTAAGSDIYKLNHSNGSPVKVSEETYDLIKKSLAYSELSDGAFDITIGSVHSLWNFTDDSCMVPSDESIKEELSHVNYQNINLLDDLTVQLTDPKTRIDLGGIAKGYIADRLKDYLLSQNVEHGIIDLGGNILTIGARTDGTAYHIGIKEPFSNQVLTSVDVNDQSVVTSGIYERYFIKDEHIYHHVFSPKTGYPVDNNLAGVTIVSSHSVDGDALSSICLILGLEDGMKLIERLDDIEAIFVTRDHQSFYSQGLQ